MMKTKIKKYGKRKAEHSENFNETPRTEADYWRHARQETSGIIDHKVALLSVAAAAVASNSTPCLEQITIELEPTGITEADIREAVESGRFLGAYPELGAKVLKKTCHGTDHEGAYESWGSKN